MQIQQTFASALKIYFSGIVQESIFSHRFRVSVVHQPTPCALVHQPTRVPATPPLAPRSTGETDAYVVHTHIVADVFVGSLPRDLPSASEDIWTCSRTRLEHDKPPVATRSHATVSSITMQCTRCFQTVGFVHAEFALADQWRCEESKVEHVLLTRSMRQAPQKGRRFFVGSLSMRSARGYERSLPANPCLGPRLLRASASCTRRIRSRRSRFAALRRRPSSLGRGCLPRRGRSRRREVLGASRRASHRGDASQAPVGCAPPEAVCLVWQWHSSEQSSGRPTNSFVMP